ncbi:MAG: transcriptional regulator GlxA family with amidase domain, partial [Saprospiraceae bacterium]
MRTIGILLFDEVEILDFAGPYEVFSIARDLSGIALFDVKTISVQKST